MSRGQVRVAQGHLQAFVAQQFSHGVEFSAVHHKMRRERVAQIVKVGVGRLSPGLGSRHASALAVTTVTEATAIVISSSSGTVSVYDHGQAVLELERAATTL